MTLVVTGATGNVGFPLVAELAAAGAQVRAVTRRPHTTEFPDGVEVVDSMAKALPGASAVFLNSRALGAQLPKVVADCAAAGISKLVALSAINADDDFSRQPSRFRGDRNKEVEQLVIDSGLPWVSLRPTVFATNFAGMWSAQIQRGDVVVGPYAQASHAPIVESDIAAVAARTLLTDDFVGQKLSLTGPQALTNAELVRVIGAALGRRLHYQEIPPEVARQQLAGAGVTAGFADGFWEAYLAMLAATLDQPALITHDVEKILDRPAQTFASWVAEHRDLFTDSVSGADHG
ncbi:NAD(P)H-binding protein [Mycobacterium sp. 1423905.2]|uniref:NAD(P)H-binding protein n=1 Tax=Mycobacterium sp. 1423905.2 TaxID=1856859 RepID=UPI0007FEB167|nr:NAD(P)H-binding protein [Mycobacterium sp. 1423905.2]OBJ54143.1 nucleoside-diphosphate sugar epimerase [Mycobacterium sp. 1423905.2]